MKSIAQLLMKQIEGAFSNLKYGSITQISGIWQYYLGIHIKDWQEW